MNEATAGWVRSVAERGHRRVERQALVPADVLLQRQVDEVDHVDVEVHGELIDAACECVEGPLGRRRRVGGDVVDRRPADAERRDPLALVVLALAVAE